MVLKEYTCVVACCQVSPDRLSFMFDHVQFSPKWRSLRCFAICEDRFILVIFSLLCPRLDSNQHVLTNTTPSRWRVYQFHHVGKALKNKKAEPEKFNFSDLTGARTQDPLLKREMLYRLSYQVIYGTAESGCKYNINYLQYKCKYL